MLKRAKHGWFLPEGSVIISKIVEQGYLSLARDFDVGKLAGGFLPKQSPIEEIVAFCECPDSVHASLTYRESDKVSHQGAMYGFLDINGDVMSPSGPHCDNLEMFIVRRGRVMDQKNLLYSVIRQEGASVLLARTSGHRPLLRHAMP